MKPGAPAHQVAAYLRRATRGVPRSRRQELWDELEDHLLTRSRHLQALGLPQDAALAQAIAEVGAPGRVSVGMGQVFHTGALTAALGAVLVTATLLTLRPTPAPAVLSVSPVWPHLQQQAACSTPCRAGATVDVWLQPTEVAAALRRPGVWVRVARDGRVQVGWRGRQVTVPASRVPGARPRTGAVALTMALLRVVPELSVRGYNRMPGLQGGPVAVTLSPAEGQMTSATYYRGLGRALLARISPGAPVEATTGHAPRHRLTTALAPGEVVMLVTRDAAGHLVADVAPVGTGGRVTLRSAAPHHGAGPLTLVAGIGEVRPGHDDHSPALLVRLTGVPLGQPPAGILQASVQD